MKKNFQCDTVVVTGGASGIGKAFCEKFAEFGASNIVVVDLHYEDAKRVADSIPGGVAMRADCGVEMDIRKVILKTEFEVGPIDVFVANAGIPANGGTEVPNDEWDRIWRVNVMQHIFVARHLFPLYKSRGYGSMLITASAAGLLTQIGSLPYSVTKHAAVSVAEWLQISHRSDNIRVSCLCPQAVKTGMVPEGGDGGVAGSDGTLDPRDVAAESIQVLSRGEFLVLPHKKVKVYMQRKAADYDRWLRGMHRVHLAMGEIMRKTPPISAAKL